MKKGVEKQNTLTKKQIKRGCPAVVITIPRFLVKEQHQLNNNTLFDFVK